MKSSGNLFFGTKKKQNINLHVETWERVLLEFSAIHLSNYSTFNDNLHKYNQFLHSHKLWPSSHKEKSLSNMIDLLINLTKANTQYIHIC